MPGSGKTALSRLAQDKGIPVVMMGDIVRKETAKRDLKPTPENIGKTMLKLREEDGSAAIAKKCLQEILHTKSKTVVVEGIRSLEEVKEFKKNLPNFTLIAVHASPKTRYHRLHNRGRSDDPKNWNEFTERDERELSVGISSAIATADHVITNENTLSQFETEAKKLLAELTENGQN